MSFFLQSTGWGRKTQISWVSHFPTGEILEQTGRQRPQFNINIWVTFYVLLLRVAAFFVLGKEIFCSNKGFLDSTRSFLVLNPLVSSEETVETSRERIFFSSRTIGEQSAGASTQALKICIPRRLRE